MNYIHLLHQFNQLSDLLNEHTDLKNVWMTTPDLWNSYEHKLLCYLKLNASKSEQYLVSEDFRVYIYHHECQFQENFILHLATL